MSQTRLHVLLANHPIRTAALVFVAATLVFGCSEPPIGDTPAESSDSGAADVGVDTTGGLTLDTGNSSSGADGGSSDTSSSGGTSGGATDSGGTSGGATTACPTDIFLNMSKAAGAGGSYAKPTLSVSCTDDLIVVKSNTMISYKYVPMTPNALKESAQTYNIPRSPKVAATTTKIPFLGRVGVAVNGVPLFGPNEGPIPDNFGDPILNGIMDECGGHTAAQYHYHQFIYKCLRQVAISESEPWKLKDVPTDKAWGIVGYAMDGFPIYGRWGCVDKECTKVIEFKSGFEAIGDPKELAWDNHKFVKKDGEAYLDECNGRYGPDGTYRYHETASFPYGIACYRGTANDTGSGGNRGGSSGGGASGGGSSGGGSSGGGAGGPASCAANADCNGKCPAGSAGCTCHQSPQGKICVPTCKSTSDCPKDQGGQQMSCDQGICKPSKPPMGG
mgnify:CR=1 FL=1